MKHSIIFFAVLAMSLLITGCGKHVRLQKYAMHGNDKIVPTKPVENSYIDIPTSRKSFRAVPAEILDKYFDKIPDETQRYNISMKNLKINGSDETQDKITLTFITAVVDHELKEAEYKPDRQLIELGVKRIDLRLPEIKLIDQTIILRSNNISRDAKKKYSDIRRRYERMVKIDNLVKELFVKCGLNDKDRFWFKKFALLKYEFIGYTWSMYLANKEMEDAL